MTGSIPPANPLSYEGQIVVPFIQRNFPPTTAFNKFPVPTIWIDPQHMNAYILVAKPLGVADWILIGGGTGTLQTITTPDATIVTPVAANINFLNGTGMNITGSGNNITFNATGMSLNWTVVNAATQTLAVNNGYISNNGAGVVFSLPTTCAVGSIFIVTAKIAAGWSITQSAGQMIQFGKFNTTTGAGGSLASTQVGDTACIVCDVANTSFIVLSSLGDITYV